MAVRSDGGGAKDEQPERIGRYRIAAEIGRGGMAVVYRAVLDGPRGFAKEVCLKRILPSSSTDPMMVEMFEREARLAATLQHANVVQVFDFEIHEGTPFLVMELVDGPSLWGVFGAASRAGRPIPVDIACGVVVQALQGLHHVHTRTLNGKPMGLVHRDVSLHNVLVSRSGEVKVADFGIARATMLGERTRTGLLKGKLAYIAPEYAATGKADRRGDLFSAGVVLHELLSGRRRTPPTSEAEGLGWVLHPELTSLVELRPEVPDRLAGVVASLTAARPDDRPTDAAEAAAQIALAAPVADAEALARYLAGLFPANAARCPEPTLIVPDGDPGETVPTPSPFDPTATRQPTAVAAVPPAASVRPDATPDASTTIADAALRAEAARRRRRRTWIGAGAAAALVFVVGSVWLASSPDMRPSGDAVPAPRQVGAPPPAPDAEGPGAPSPAPAAVPSPAVEASAHPSVEVPPAAPAPPAVEGASGDADAGAGPDAGEAPEPAVRPVFAAEDRDAAVPAFRRGDVAAAHASRDAARPGSGAPAPTGTLTVFARPWAYISVDGAPAQDGSVLHFVLAGGPHRVVLENPGVPCRLETGVDVTAGTEVTLRRDLTTACGRLDAGPADASR